MVIECVIEDKVSISYVSDVVPRIGESVIVKDKLYVVLNVLHYFDNSNVVSVILKKQ